MAEKKKSKQQDSLAHFSRFDFIRLIYAILFTVIYSLVTYIIYFLAIIQSIIILFAGAPNSDILSGGSRLKAYIVQILNFLVGESNEKPFPFSSLPPSPENTE